MKIIYGFYKKFSLKVSTKFYSKEMVEVEVFQSQNQF